jgi:hypothetical protein
MGCVDDVWPNLPVASTCVRNGSEGAVDESTGRALGHKVKWPLPLYHSTALNCSGQTTGSCNADIVEQPANLGNLAERYKDFAHTVIGVESAQPFFLYV